MVTSGSTESLPREDFLIEERLSYNVSKRVLDLALGSLACMLSLPLSLMLAIAIKATSKGPVLFKQTRIGKGGKPFTLMKFRTMVHNCDPSLHQDHMRRLIAASSGQPMHKLANDPRVTRLGRYLRDYKVDELPQLLNVLSGSMSLVGPRPPIPYEVELYNEWHMNRLRVTPGITGLWQVNGGNEASFDDMIQMDLDYIRNRSLLLDLRILIRTVIVVLTDYRVRDLVRSLLKKATAFFLYYSGLIAVLRRAGRDYSKIVLYHSVDVHENSFIKGTNIWIHPDTFRKHLDYIRKHYLVIPLKSLVDATAGGTSPPRSVVITFDDGFADNFHHAYPFLKQHDLPATIFLTANSVDNKRPLWIQEVCYLFNHVDFEELIKHLNAIARDLHLSALVIADNPDLPRRKQVEQYLAYSVRPSDRDLILDGLYRALGIDKEVLFSNHPLFLNLHQIRQMLADGITFGNHGASHTPLSALPPEEQKQEIDQSKRALQEQVQLDFLPFSYPFGGASDFTSESTRLVKEAGHDCALSTMATLNRREAAAFELDRIPIGNIPVYQLAFELEKPLLKSLLLKRTSPVNAQHC